MLRLTKAELTCGDCLQVYTVSTMAGCDIDTIKDDISHDCQRHLTEKLLTDAIQHYLADVDSYGDWTLERTDLNYVRKTFIQWFKTYGE